ncbi:MAG: hypothetical protein ACD_22C00069G0005 [uncultured bacterium]|nr:MAG: hypothetical protein ACD_22C00069G0005 [uncultured bacterium]
MHYYITTCCKEKETKSKLLPAIDRYLNPRIKQVYNLSIKDNIEFLILSGKYGLLKPEDKIPYYDQILLDRQVQNIVDTIIAQSIFTKGDCITVFGKHESEHPSWKPYYDAIRTVSSKLGLSLSIKQLVTPKLFAFIGDFAAGKTTTARWFSHNPDIFLAKDIFSYISFDNYKNFTKGVKASKAYSLNAFRDTLINNANKQTVVCDEDLVELLAYEFSLYVIDQTNIYYELLGQLKDYRRTSPHLFPLAYIDLLVERPSQKIRMKQRSELERSTPEYFTRHMTQVAYRMFYNEIGKKLPENGILSLNTTTLSKDQVIIRCKDFIFKILEEDYFFIDIFKIIDQIDLKDLKNRTLMIYEHTKES